MNKSIENNFDHNGDYYELTDHERKRYSEYIDYSDYCTIAQTLRRGEYIYY